MDWKPVTPSNSPMYMVKGTELNKALCGSNNRFCIYEIRSYDMDNNADRKYVIRDANTVSDEDIRNGIRPKVVATFDYEDEAINFCILHN